MGAMASHFTSLTIVYSTVYSGADQSKHRSSASLAFVWGFHRRPVNSPHKCPLTREMLPLDDVIIITKASACFMRYVVPLCYPSQHRRWYSISHKTCTCCRLYGNRTAICTWWRHQMEIFSALLAVSVGNSSATVEFPSQRPVTQSFAVFFVLCQQTVE